MLAIPIQTPGHDGDAVIIVIDSRSLARMKEGDPGEIELRKTDKHLINPAVMICCEEMTPQFMQLIHAGDLTKIIAYLRRGWKFRPEQGDHDRGPEKLSEGS